jgi:hypothetical protein
MLSLFLALVSTVPREYPYFEKVKFEVSLVTLPAGIDSADYSRALTLEYSEDSLISTVRGVVVERFAHGSARGIRADCDSTRTRGDTLVAFSHLLFRLTRLGAEIVYIDLPMARRVPSHKSANMYSSEIVLERLGLWQRGTPCKSCSRCAVESEYGKGFAQINLVTGAFISLRLEPQK